MTRRITLLCVPATAALRAGRFPADEPLDAAQIASVASLAANIAHDARKPDHVLCSPMACARDTVQALGLQPRIEADLREIDYGRWTGRSLKDIAIAQPEAMADWLSNPDAAAHGSESMCAIVARVGRWADHYPWAPGHTLVVTHASVIRAWIVHILQAPAQACGMLDIAPLTQTTLSWQEGRWRVRSMGELTH